MNYFLTIDYLIAGPENKYYVIDFSVKISCKKAKYLTLYKMKSSNHAMSKFTINHGPTPENSCQIHHVDQTQTTQKDNSPEAGLNQA